MRNRRFRAGGSGRRSVHRGGLPVGSVGGALLDASSAALSAPQVVQLGPTHLALAGYFQRFNERRVERKDPLDADTGGDAAHGEVGRRPLAMGAPDANALECLHAFPRALADAEVDADGVPRPEFGDALVDFWRN